MTYLKIVQPPLTDAISSCRAARTQSLEVFGDPLSSCGYAIYQNKMREKASLRMEVSCRDSTGAEVALSRPSRSLAACKPSFLRPALNACDLG